MEEKYYKITRQKKEDIVCRIECFLENYPDLLFAYVHGSFISQDQFRDIDVAIYIKSTPTELLLVELDLEAKLYNLVQYPVDVRILNSAPLSFRYNVIKDGRRLAVIDDDARCDFEEMTVSNYFDFAPYRKMYLQEALNRGV
ncbi:MAG: nucleotidyltransferase domain-containing protein [Smithellaceae bacterium]|nr:nucleotidyltransferase domain-containing protein [Smithellaceae bacterium]